MTHSRFSQLCCLFLVFVMLIGCEDDVVPSTSSSPPQNTIDTISGQVAKVCVPYEWSPNGYVYYDTLRTTVNYKIAIHTDNGQKYVLRANSSWQDYQKVYFDSLGVASHYDSWSHPNGSSSRTSDFTLRKLPQGYELTLIHISSQMGRHEDCIYTGILVE